MSPVLRRRTLLAAIATMSTVGALTACGGTADPSPANTAAPGTSASSGGGYPVAIEHMYGTTQIPARPTKILTLGLSDQDSVLALGEKPIAVSEWYGKYASATWPWAQDELGGTKPVVLNKGLRDEAKPPIEEIASLEPDLIVSLYNGTTKEQYEQLSEIAPVLVPTKEFADFNITWQESLRVTGLALGKVDQAAGITKGLEQKFADAAKANPGFSGQEVVIAERFKPGESVVRSGKDMRAKFFEDLGFTIPTQIGTSKANKAGEINVPDERIDELSKDLLVWNIGPNPAVRSEIEKIALYDSLKVVKDKKVMWVEDPVISGAFTWGTALSLDYALQKLLPTIRSTAGG